MNFFYSEGALWLRQRLRTNKVFRAPWDIPIKILFKLEMCRTNYRVRILTSQLKHYKSARFEIAYKNIMKILTAYYLEPYGEIPRIMDLTALVDWGFGVWNAGKISGNASKEWKLCPKRQDYGVYANSGNAR